MSLQKKLKDTIRRSLHKMGYSLYRMSDEERQAVASYEREVSVQADTSQFNTELPRLRELRERYAKVQLPIAIHSVWGSRGGSGASAEIGWGDVNLPAFRGHNAYVWSYVGADPITARLKNFIFADAVRRRDPANLLGKLQEDGAFGCMTFEYPGIKRISRDLLDSVIEINFLHKHLNVLSRDDLRVLDIGAGYGRMAHRMLEANPRIKSYTCVDAVPESTFLSEFYLRHRGLRDKAQVLPADELEQKLVAGSYDLALNIHSFSECTFAAIEWWLTQLRRLQVRHLMIIPNNPTDFLSTETDHSRRDYAPLLKKLGYELVFTEPVFEDPAVRDLIANDNMFLFQLRA